MLFPIWLGFDLTVLFDWLVLKELAHRKWRKEKAVTVPDYLILQCSRGP